MSHKTGALPITLLDDLHHLWWWLMMVVMVLENSHWPPDTRIFNVPKNILENVTNPSIYRVSIAFIIILNLDTLLTTINFGLTLSQGSCPIVLLCVLPLSLASKYKSTVCRTRALI